MSPPVRVRRESPKDVAAIRRVHNAAFGEGADVLTWEGRLVDDLRAGPNWIPALSLVAEVEGVVVGHVVATRGRLEPVPADRPVRALGLAPLGVLPEHQHLRLGTALMYAVLGAAEALGEEVVCLLGAPAYYGRFGFVIASTVGIAPPVPGWAPHFQALVMGDGSATLPTGTFHYDEAFDRPPLIIGTDRDEKEDS